MTIDEQLPEPGVPAAEILSVLVVIDIAKLQPLEQFAERMERFVAELKAVPLAKGVEEIFYGETGAAFEL